MDIGAGSHLLDVVEECKNHLQDVVVVDSFLVVVAGVDNLLVIVVGLQDLKGDNQFHKDHLQEDNLVEDSCQ